MDDSYTVDAIDAQIAWREATMAQLHDDIESLRRARAILLDGGPGDSPPPPVDSATPNIIPPPKAGTIRKEMYDAIFPLLVKSGILTRKDIAEQVMAMGIYLSGDTPEQRVTYLGGFLRHGVQWNGLMLKSMLREDPRLRGHWTVEDALAVPTASPGPAYNRPDESSESLQRQTVDSSNRKPDTASDNRRIAGRQ